MTILPQTKDFAAASEDSLVIGVALDQAVRRIAPLWPLDRFVAVNPFLGLVDRPFEEAAWVARRTMGASMLMSRAFYADAIALGRIADVDLQAALDAGLAGAPTSVAGLKAAALAKAPPPPARIATLVDIASKRTGENWAGFMTERLSRFAALWFDRSQSDGPTSQTGFFAAWKAHAVRDLTPDILGLKGFRKAIAALPEDPVAAATLIVRDLGVTSEALLDYLHAAAAGIAGWAGYARFKLWEAELAGGADGDAVGLLVARLAFEHGIAAALASPGLKQDWALALADLRAPLDPSVYAVEHTLQRAYEHAWRRAAFAKLAASRTDSPARPAVQAAFCIDVRSEVFRRALEAAAPSIQTIGFAGFFGFSLDVFALGASRGKAHCPVLLKPGFLVCESVGDDGALARTRAQRNATAQGWKTFKTGAVSAFSFIETAAVGYLPKLVTDSLGLSRPTPHPKRAGLRDDEARAIAPSIAADQQAGRAFGFTSDQRLAAAEAVLRAMSMTRDFARIVVLAGHGSSSVNNPHASGLDCGACGGHTGEANARVAAMIMNDTAVRAGLVAKGIVIPDDTVFVAGLHDTTTDELRLFDLDAMPATHAQDLAALRAHLAKAAQAARAERAHALRIAKGEALDTAIQQRARDWSQVRPEWGLAGCAAFIAAPRARTLGVDLGGRAFLHSYDWRQDAEFGVLELIMTAPVVVASWISLQYYGSSVDNRAFGSGNKTLHNVVAGLGVLEGHGGDLRAGLPWQSVHDGERLVHEPMRLAVVIEAPIEAMNAVIARHAGLRDLFDNGWLHLFAMDDQGRVAHQYAGDRRWAPIAQH